MEDEVQTGSESNHKLEAKVPNLIELCTEQLKNQILLDGFIL